MNTTGSDHNPHPTSKDLDDLDTLRDAIDAVPHPFSVYDHKDRLVACSRAYRELHGMDLDAQVQGQELLHADIVAASFRHRLGVEDADRKIAAEIARHRLPGGYTKDVNTLGYWARRVKRVTSSGTVVGFSINIDELVKKTNDLAVTKKQLEHQASHDPLSGLPNRRGLQHFMNSKLDDEGRALQNLAVLHLDLDKFKAINDTLGHDAGDAVLLEASSILRNELRASDYVARVGGDEFIIICQESEQEAEMAAICTRLIARMSEPIQYEDEICQIGASIGVSFCPKGWSIGRVMINADLALYEAKRNGRGCHCFYSTDLRNQHQRNEMMGHEIRNGIQAGEFEPFFQPQINAATGQIAGFEALVRWRHSSRGLISPAEFIPAAEEAGLMGDIDQVMMAKSFAAMRKWRDAGFDVPQISINMSGDRLAQSASLDQIKWCAEHHNLEPECIGLEVLESVLVEEDEKNLINNVQALSEAGFRIELDDFGTGHASISGLRTLSIDRIKIDRSLITNIHRDDELKTITAAIIGLARALDIEVLAEGVESDAEHSTLIAMGCGYIQGFGISRPLPSGHVEEWLHSYQAKIVRPLRLA